MRLDYGELWALGVRSKAGAKVNRLLDEQRARSSARMTSAGASCLVSSCVDSRANTGAQDVGDECRSRRNLLRELQQVGTSACDGAVFGMNVEVKSLSSGYFETCTRSKS